MTTTGVSNLTMTDALECAISYAHAGCVPTGRTLDEMEYIRLQQQLVIAKALERRQAGRER